jgi:hypothetical protein
MNLIESLAIKPFVADYPEDWTMDDIIDHLYYSYDESPRVKLTPVYVQVNGDEVAALIRRTYIKLKNLSLERP